MNAILKPREVICDNAAWPQASARLTVLIPFLNDDPGQLLAALDGEARDCDGAVEVVILDDGSRDAALTARLSLAVEQARLPARLLTLAGNLGRARGRNRLAAEARGRWLLFLDSDMLPDRPNFLRACLELIASGAPAVAFGGFSLDQAPTRPELALHRFMALKSDCTPVEERRRAPEKHVFTSNLLVRRDIFVSQPFDDGFSGWGWEDVEWAMRVGRDHSILHWDNPATHLGLDPAPVMVRKYEQSAANFARVVAAHPEIVAHYPSYRAARLLKPVPFRSLWRPLLRTLGLAEGAPLGLRNLALRIYRAALYADVI
jgi:glycosyltransferase involved in cell wall biosynthesis